MALLRSRRQAPGEGVVAAAIATRWFSGASRSCGAARLPRRRRAELTQGPVSAP